MKKPPIVFIHGAFVTPSSFEPLMGYFKARGFEVLAPAWPSHGQSVAELRKQQDSSELGKLGLGDLTNYFADIIKALPEKPIIIGHSFGGLLTQLMMDRGLGLAGIAIDSAGAKGVVSAAYPTSARSIFGILSKPWRKTFMMSLKEFQYAFVHTLGKAEQERAYREHVVPETTRIFFQGAAAPFASNSPFKVDFNNGRRGPLLMIAGEVDRIVPASLVRKNYSLYNQRSGAVTDYKEFPGRSHWIIAQPGWEEVADFIDQWLKERLPAEVG
ncbi:alpha/beta hydrolase [Paenibacillus zanthoxyli]|uniref:alpha/beta hydrolase n=1 Tax=Paenibacillus zanthoxyli TaxID=369399 RepID=UPI00047141B5|nr:alpha/beta hydrolase [Paenibacillus zanthoxyli]